MKKLITVLMSCSLALVAGALAQQDDNSPAPKKKQHGQPEQAAAPARTQNEHPAATQNHEMRGHEQGAERHNVRHDTNANENQPAHGADRTQAHHPDTQPDRGMQARPEQPNARSDARANEERTAHHNPQAQSSVTNAAQSNGNANVDSQTQHHGRGEAARVETSQTNGDASATMSERQNAHARSTQTETASQMNHSQSQTDTVKTAQTKKADIQTIKTEHANFHAQPKPEKVPAVTFNQSHTITGSEKWQGQQYTVFRSYRPAYHDQSWYRSHYNRIELIGGGNYYFNGGYWYPAWGYEPSAQYYVYDGPIYAGREAVPPDQVIADVQAALQQMGYYRGEVDGLLGPLTREALTGYQNDHGLYTTAAIDQPTLDSLGI